MEVQAFLYASLSQDALDSLNFVMISVDFFLKDLRDLSLF